MHREHCVAALAPLRSFGGASRCDLGASSPSVGSRSGHPPDTSARVVPGWEEYMEREAQQTSRAFRRTGAQQDMVGAAPAHDTFLEPRRGAPALQTRSTLVVAPLVRASLAAQRCTVHARLSFRDEQRRSFWSFGRIGLAYSVQRHIWGRELGHGGPPDSCMMGLGGSHGGRAPGDAEGGSRTLGPTGAVDSFGARGLPLVSSADTVSMDKPKIQVLDEGFGPRPASYAVWHLTRPSPLCGRLGKMPALTPEDRLRL